jgi:hypothetical protein
MQRVATQATEFPAMRHDEERDWWIVAFQAPVKLNGSSKPLLCELVIAGIAAE